MQLVLVCIAGCGYFWIERVAGNQLAGNQIVWILVAVLDRFDSQKRRPQDHRQDETDDRVALFTDLSAVDGHRHSETADDQDRCVDGAEAYVQMVARERKGGGIWVRLKRVGQEKCAKEHDFSDEKNHMPN